MRRFEQKNCTIPAEFDRLALRNPSKTAIICHQKQWTFDQLRKFSNRVSNVFYIKGYRKNDRIALFIDSRPEFIGKSSHLICTEALIKKKSIN